MKKLLIFIALGGLVYACGQDTGQAASEEDERLGAEENEALSEEEQMIAEGKGIGEVKQVDLNDPLDPDMVQAGQGIYDMKCSACHKLTDQRVVGPGWKGVTDRRKPEWIMNMITNVEMMLANDPAAQAQLEQCLVRMPNQNLSTGDAREVLEFMYYNDGYEVAGQQVDDLEQEEEG